MQNQQFLMYPCVLWLRAHEALRSIRAVFVTLRTPAWASGPHLYCARRQTRPESHLYIWGDDPSKDLSPVSCGRVQRSFVGAARLLLTVGAGFGGLCSPASHVPAMVVQVSLCVPLVHGFNILSSRSEIEGDQGFSV